MFVYFLRHASAGQRRVGTSEKKDEKRALDKDGIEQCGFIGRALAALGVQVDVIITSPLKRAMQTAALVGNEMGHEGKLVKENALRPESGFADFQKILEKYARQDAIMLVGHNPNLRDFLGRVISDTGCEAVIELKKGAVAKVEMRRNAGSLSWCITPRILRTLHTAATESSRPKTSRK
ncbi:MAG TPA: phosphoglycerate mutase family protein [Terriglobales bacterium]|nr:phosphoglycerate mutase family protein [Terriglobales bacterium]